MGVLPSLWDYSLCQWGLFWCRWCKDTDAVVMNFKTGNRQIDATCAAITETSLLLIEKKRQYDHREFTLCQADHHAAVRAALAEQPSACQDPCILLLIAQL